MRRAVVVLGIALVAASSTGCEGDLTEILVVVDSNLTVPTEIDTVRIDVSGIAGGPKSSMGQLSGGRDPIGLPRTLALVHDGGDLGPIDVRGQVLLGTTVVLERTARVSFVDGEVRVLRIDLDRDCLGITCTGEMTCSRGACRAVTVAASELPAWTGTVPRRDAGAGGDSAVITPERCNMMDDDSDGRIDEGFDLTTDPANCGRCGTRCAPPAGGTTSCAAGACTLVCMAGRADCDMDAITGCEASLTAPETCGSCTNDCSVPHTTSMCTGMMCTVTGCEAGFGDCDTMAANGCEEALTTVVDCGTCGTACAPANATGTCATGTCVIASCSAGFADCDMSVTNGCETPTTTLTDCGACGTACALAGGTETCATGMCEVDTCDVGAGNCDMMSMTGCETPLTTLTDCGACGTACAPANATGDCATGMCAIGMCSMGFGDCDTMAATGCEARFATDDLHCGSCPVACTATQGCVAGTCRGDTEVLQVAAGAAHTCALQVGGTVRCWGSNANGQLGDGTMTERITSVAVSMVTDARMIAAGSQHTCALRATGQVACWGANSDGQLGDASTTRRLTRVAVMGLADAVWIAAGARHTCAVRATGAVVCWGDNGDDQIGDGGPGPRRTTPATVTGIADGARVAGGEAHTCALRATGAVSCWGRNSSGQLGDASTTDRATPVAVMGLVDATDLTTGAAHSCVTRMDGSVMCWGENGSSQLGIGGTTDRNAPAAVAGIVDGIEIDGGGSHTCVRRTTGALSCWGRNAEGQLGDASTTARPMPVAVMTVMNATSLATGGNHSCAARATGAVACWGVNTNGQLGDGSRTTRTAPVVVTGLP